MRILRYILLVASLIPPVGVIYFVATAPILHRADRLSAIPIIVMFGLNFFYILRCPPGAYQGKSRLMKLYSLWLDAKERELKNRANNPPQ